MKADSTTDADVVREALKLLRLGVTEFERMDAADRIQHTGEQALDRLEAERDQLRAALQSLYDCITEDEDPAWGFACGDHLDQTMQVLGVSGNSSSASEER